MVVVAITTLTFTTITITINHNNHMQRALSPHKHTRAAYKLKPWYRPFQINRRELSCQQQQFKNQRINPINRINQKQLHLSQNSNHNIHSLLYIRHYFPTVHRATHWNIGPNLIRKHYEHRHRIQTIQ